MLSSSVETTSTHIPVRFYRPSMYSKTTNGIYLQQKQICRLTFNTENISSSEKQRQQQYDGTYNIHTGTRRRVSYVGDELCEECLSELIQKKQYSLFSCGCPSRFVRVALAGMNITKYFVILKQIRSPYFLLIESLRIAHCALIRWFPLLKQLLLGNGKIHCQRLPKDAPGVHCQCQGGLYESRSQRNEESLLPPGLQRVYGPRRGPQHRIVRGSRVYAGGL
mmetsp:Transcript_12407/g.29083  ORF Transcript_12407/g.29083 Transcript_12407/m.29083 type:complete len:222 (-) Transcript_12407:532-1197(-)